MHSILKQDSTQNILKQYVEDKNIKGFLVDVVETILLEKPSEPIGFTVKYLRGRYPHLFKNVNDEQDNHALSNDDVESITESDDGDSQTESDSCSDSDSVVTREESDPTPLPITARPRRSSICAEKMCETKVESEELRIIPKTDEERIAINVILSKCVLFEHLDDIQMKNVEDAMFPVVRQAEEIIIKQGDAGDNFYVIEQGNVHVYIESNNGDNTDLVNSYTEGDSFGELAIMYNSPRAATCVAKNGPVKLWALDRVSFKTILMKTAIEKRNQYISFLRDVPILSQLNEFELMTIADALHEEFHNEGDIIFKEGDIGDRFYIVESGTVICTKISADGTIHQIAELRKGSYFGEIALMTSKRRQASVMASSSVHCLSLDSKTFKRVMHPLQESLIRTMEKY